MRWLWVFFAVSVQGLSAQGGRPDSAFDRIPFEEWMGGAGQALVKWSAAVQPVVLSNHQRLLQQVSVQVDGAEVARRRGKGELVIFFEITDSAGLKFRDHSSIDLAKVEEGIKASDIVFTEGAFLLPGDYSLSLAIYWTGTQEHAVRREKVRVARKRGDPLPEAWSGLPEVEIRPVEEAPDLWFQPQIHGRLHLKVEMQRPTQIDLLLNLTPSERATGSQRAQDMGLAVMLPAMKVLANVDWRNATTRLTLLDLLRQKVAFDEKDTHGVDWPAMKTSLGGMQTGQIDVKSLGDRQHQASFFVSEVRKRLAPAKAVIILSAITAFEGGEDLSPIEATLPRDCRVFYVRFHQQVKPAAAPVPPYDRRLPMRGMGTPAARQVRSQELSDQLEATLKPIHPKLFEVENPEQFRAALAAILAELQRGE